MALEPELQLPDGFRIMENQVAGHTFADQSSSLGMLMQENSNCVLKPLGKPECGKRELNFYEALNSSSDQQLQKLKTLVPRYYNKLHLTVNKKQHTFIQLEDLTHNMKMPCIMDVKIGRRTWDPLATEQKRKVEEEKYIKCKQPLGLCLPGFQMYRKESDSTHKLYRYGKEYGKNLNESGFRETIALFLNSQHTVRRDLVEEVLRQLYEILNWFTTQNIYHFYASSILIVYDATGFSFESENMVQGAQCFETAINGHTNNINGTICSKRIPQTFQTLRPTPQNASIVKVRMIDFAHVFPAEGGTLDQNYLFGLRNLITILEDLLQY